MSLPNGVYELGMFLSGMAENVAHQQLRLNRDYEKKLEEFLPVLQQARGLGYEELARSIAPSQVHIDKVELEVKATVSITRGHEFSISIKALNSSYTRQYQYSEFVQNTLTFEVVSVPVPPGQPQVPQA